MKSKISKIIVCILAISALICAFSAVASAETSTPIYIGRIGSGDGSIEGVNYTTWANTMRIYLTPEYAGTETDGVFDKNDNFGMKTTKTDGVVTPVNSVFHAIDVNLSEHKSNLVESGLFYTFDSVTGKMTITGKIKKQSDGKDVPWIIPAVDGKLSTIKEIEIAEETGITRIMDHCMNNCTSVTKITIPSTMTVTENESISRMAKLTTIKVQGSEYDTGIDLRKIKSFNSQTFHSNFTSNTSTTVYIGNSLMGSDAWLANKSVGKDSGTGEFIVYAPSAESCIFATSFATGRVNGTKYDVTIIPYSNCAVTQLGYQVRTADYNGFRSRFVYRTTPGYSLKLAEAGVVLDTPKKITMDHGTAVEYGVIVGTEETFNEYGHELTKSGSEYVTANEKIKKIVADPEKLIDNKYFYVTVTKYKTKAQMEKKIAMYGYEVLSDGSIVYGTPLEPASIYDTMIGLYKNGQINMSMESGNAFWSVLDNFKLDMSDIFDGETLKPEYSKYCVLPILYTRSGSEGSYVYTGSTTNSNYDKTSEFKFKPTLDGDLYWNTDEGKKSVISFFKLSDDSYVAIARLTDESYTAFKDDPTKTVTFYGGDLTKTSSWARENFLSKNFIGIGFDTLILDDGFGAISGGALKGFGTWSKDFYVEDTSAPGEYVPYKVEFKGCLETIIYPQTLTSFGDPGNQTFHSNYNLTTVYRFGTNSLGVSECVGIADISILSGQITKDGDYFGSYFNSCRVVKVNLPSTNGFNVTIGKGMFQGSTTISGFFVDGVDVTSDYEKDGIVTGSKIDFTGLGYIFKNGGTSGSESDYTKAFEKSDATIKCIINTNGDVNVRTNGNVWVTSPAAG